jgi:hypothetical protein
MRKALAAGMAALTFGGAVAASALPTAAQARDWRGGYYGGYYGGRHHHGNDAAAAAIVAGVAGLALGAALSNNNRGYYNRGYYGGYPGDYSGYGGYGGYGYAPGYDSYGYAPYASCSSSRWVYDPYIGRRVLITSHYAC